MARALSAERGQANVVLTIVVVIILLAIAFYAGHAFYGAPSAAMSTPASTASTTAATAPADSGYYADVASWQTENDPSAGFTLAYPLDFNPSETGSVAPSTDWRTDTQDPGVLAFTLTVPSTFEPQTNFADAKLTVGYSSADAAVADCLSPLPSAAPAAATSTVSINGITFTVWSGNDAGAGNLYDTTSYRTMHAGRCYAVDYTIHSTQLANYPASYGLTQFDEAKVKAVLDRIVGTFTFL